MTVLQINDQLMKLVVNERKLTHEILKYIASFYKYQGYLQLGYSSIIHYLTKHLGYSDDQAYRRWQAAKLLLQVPEVGENLTQGELNLSQAAKVQKAFELAAKESEKVLSKEQKQAVIAKLKNKSNFETEKLLAENLHIKPDSQDRVKPQADKTVRLDVQLTEAQYEKFKMIKGLISHQIPDQKAGDILEAVFDFFIDKKQGRYIKKEQVKDERSDSSISCSPQTKTQIAVKDKSLTQSFRETQKANDPSPFLRTTEQKSTSRYIPKVIKQAVFARANGRCEFVGEKGEPCCSEFQLEYDHIVPVAEKQFSRIFAMFAKVITIMQREFVELVLKQLHILLPIDWVNIKSNVLIFMSLDLLATYRPNKTIIPEMHQCRQ
jgi:hypothetical protein